MRPTERLGEGSVAQLHFHPPDGSSLDVEAIVWRVDRDGLAFCFTADHQRRLGTLLAQLAGAPPALWMSTLLDLLGRRVDLIQDRRQVHPDQRLEFNDVAGDEGLWILVSATVPATATADSPSAFGTT